MAVRKKENKTIRRRLASSWISTVISITLVLVLVGAASAVLLHAKALSDYFKESVKVSVIMKDDASEAAVQAYQASLDSLPYIRSTALISREQGVAEMSAMLGGDFMASFGAESIPVSLDVTLPAEYVSPDSLAAVKERLGASGLVDEVVYQEALVASLNANLGRLTLLAAILVALLLFISVVLIGNTVRLNMFSKRYSVHTMRLVGATRGFIRRPFLAQAALQGAVAGFLALGVLAGGMYFLRREFRVLFDMFSPRLLAVVACIVLAGGVLLCVASAWIIVGSLVDMNKDELYS